MKNKKRTKRNIDRLVMWGVILFFFVLLAVAVSVRTQELSQGVPTSYEVLTVHAGDTLWGIASERCPDGMDKRGYIRAVQQKNHIGTDIFPGDKLLVPVYEKGENA